MDPLIAPFQTSTFETPKSNSSNVEEMQVESGSDSKTSSKKIMKQLEGGMNNMNLKTPIKK